MPLGGPQSRRFYIRCTLICLAGVVLCLVGAFTILYLKSPRVGMVRPWFEDVLSALQALLLFFSLATLVFKYFAQLSDGPGDSSE
jgi:uncharacterized Tic20 family protein